MLPYRSLCPCNHVHVRDNIGRTTALTLLIVYLPCSKSRVASTRKTIRFFWPKDLMDINFLSLLLQLYFSFREPWVQAKVEGKNNSTSLFERWTTHIKSSGTYVFAVTSTNCPGRKWAAYKGVPAEVEERSCSSKCWNLQTTTQSLSSRVRHSHRKGTKTCYSHLICSSLWTSLTEIDALYLVLKHTSQVLTQFQMSRKERSRLYSDTLPFIHCSNPKVPN